MPAMKGEGKGETFHGIDSEIINNSNFEVPERFIFDDRHELASWFTSIPQEWAQIVALRTGLRVFPLIFPIINFSDTLLSEVNRKTLVVQSFRAAVFSMAATFFNNPKFRSKAASASTRAEAAVLRAASTKSIEATVYGADAAISFAASAIGASGHKAIAYAASRTMDSASYAAADKSIWSAFANDILYLESEKEDLISKPLWFYLSDNGDVIACGFPNWAINSIIEFDKSQFVTQNFGGLLSLWYKTSFLRDMTLSDFINNDQFFYSVLNQPDEFWTKDEPDKVLENIIDIAGLDYDDLRRTRGLGHDGKSEPEKHSDIEHTPRLTDEATHKDLLRRKPFARALVDTIYTLYDEEGPDGFAIHIHAPWGAGKTSILKMMRRMMDPPADEKRKGVEDEGWVVVDFNAWAYEKRNPPWWPLIEQVKEACLDRLKRDDDPGPAHSLRQTWFLWKLKSDWFPLVLTFVIACALAAVLFSVGPLDLGNRLDWIPKAATILGASAGIFATFVTVGRSVIFGSGQSAKFYFDMSRDPLENVRKLFARIVEKSQRPICIFIDDLDRCNETFVVTLLEGIQTSFRHRQVAYVIAADRAWLRTSFRDCYDKFSAADKDRTSPIGYLFLEKIFQVSTPIPGMGQDKRDAYVRELLFGAEKGPAVGEEADEQKTADYSDAELDAELERLTREHGPIDNKVAREVSDTDKSDITIAALAKGLNEKPAAESERRHLLSRFVSHLPDNPRVIKRMINAFALRQTIGLMEGHLEQAAVLARWTILEQRFPAVADRLIREPKLTDAIIEEEADLPGDIASLSEMEDVRYILCGGDEDLSPLDAAIVERINHGGSK